MEVFCLDDRGLFGLGLIECVRQGFPVVPDGDFIESINTDHDLSVTEGIGGTRGLDLVDGLLALQGQVFGERTGLLPGQDVSEIIFGGQRTMCIDHAAWLFTKA